MLQQLLERSSSIEGNSSLEVGSLVLPIFLRGFQHFHPHFLDFDDGFILIRLFLLLSAMFLILYQRYSDSEAHAVGKEGSNRKG